MTAGWTLETKDFTEFVAEFNKKVENGPDIITDYLASEGAEVIKKNIMPLIPVSDRRKVHAAYSQPLTSSSERLAVNIHARGKWHYLYFPDDGGDTERHVGDQRFMLRGAEASVNEIINNLEQKLVKSFNE